MNSVLIKKIAAILAIFVVSVFVYSKYGNSDKEAILNGNVEMQDVNVSFRQSGRIVGINFGEGRVVKKGDTLAVLETDILEARVQQARATLKESEIHLANAKKDYERNTALYKKKSISEKIYEDSKTNYQIAIAKNTSALALSNLESINLNDACLKSPCDGIILTKNVEIGEMASSNAPAFSIMPIGKTKIRTYGDAKVLSNIKVGQKVYVSSIAIQNKKFGGYISYISDESEFTPRNIETEEMQTSLMYRISVTLDELNDTCLLKAGMPVRVHLRNVR